MASTWTAVVPVRRGSKGLPGKNLRPLAGKPLYRHAVDLALAAGATRVIVSTDIPEILAAPETAGVSVLERPAELCADETPMAPVLKHALDALAVSGPVVLLQATSPLRRIEQLREALARFAAGGVELVMSVTAANRSVLKWGFVNDGHFTPIGKPEWCFANRQQLPAVYRPNGAIYVVDSARFRREGSFVTPQVGVVVMPEEDSGDIDSLADFEHCAAVLAARNEEEKR
ncbi:MAG TPA: acylneuraminate cytidylyltransferase family protein [Rhodocyclaceae bacterium]